MNDDGVESKISTPEITAIPRHITQVSLGGTHACATLSDGELRCWGNNSTGQLGIGSTTTQSTPLRVPTLSNPKQLAMGNTHSCALGANSQLYCWGNNESLQLGLTGADNRLSPTTVTSTASNPPSTPTTLIGAGYYASCAVTNGKNFCWGGQSYGGLGDGHGLLDGSTAVPQPLRSLSTAVRQFALGLWSGCAIDASDALWCWGYGVFGQNGDGDNSNDSTPQRVTLEATPTHISGVNGHYCLSNSNGNAQCWGYNNRGQLGTNEVSATNSSPQTVLLAIGTTLTSVIQVAVGDGHSCALLNDGSVRCWGRNSDGKLGIDSTNTLLLASTAVSLGVGNPAIEIFSGFDFNCALLSDRTTLKCWGDNAYGQLGDDTTTDRLTPVTVKLN